MFNESLWDEEEISHGDKFGIRVSHHIPRLTLEKDITLMNTK